MSPAAVRTEELRDVLSRFALKSIVRHDATAKVTVEEGKLVFSTARLTSRLTFEGDLAGSVRINSRILARLAPFLPKSETTTVDLKDGALTLGETIFTRETK